MALLEVKNLGISFGGLRAVDGFNITIEKGQLYGLIGPNGAGKTTLIKLLCRLYEPTEGTITINGQKLNKIRRRQTPKFRRKIGVVFQDFRLLKDRNVYENVAFAQRIVQTPSKEIKKNVPSILSTVGLAGKYKARPKQLSGGEQQRVALARALVNNPPILLADEPTGNLDSKTSQDVLGLLKVTGRKFKQTIVMITHNEEIAQMADRIIRIEDGRILAGGGQIHA